jgi:hypothetical protein
MQMLILRFKWKSSFLSLDTKNNITGIILRYTSLNVSVETETKNPLFRRRDRPKSSNRRVKHLLIYVRWEALFWISVLQYDNITYRFRLNRSSTYLSIWGYWTIISTKHSGFKSPINMDDGNVQRMTDPKCDITSTLSYVTKNM